MGIPREPKPVKYFIALLSSEPGLISAIEGSLTAILGTIDARSEILPWTASTYYEKEMGAGLLRSFVAFECLGSPGRLADIKLVTQRIEENHRHEGPVSLGRRINLDPGYIESAKVVLASTKNASQRIYLHSGIYAEVTLQFYHGEFHGSFYTYPDYLRPATIAFLTSLRSRYLEQLKRGD
ncbi:MAG TPA: DUF4416 family protein [Candidatus Acidoferrales bacterium]|nr:DUF4416 family protein [Candidatus Acidoferrales bacterium]